MVHDFQPPYEKKISYAMDQLDNSKEDLLQLQKEMKSFYGTINTSIQNLEEKLTTHNQQLLESTQRIQNSILKNTEYGTNNREKDAIFQAKSEKQFFKNSFSINFDNINENNYKDLEILLEPFVKDEAVLKNREILKDNCLIIIQLIYYFTKHCSTNAEKNLASQSLLFELSRFTMEKKVYFGIIIKTAQQFWTFDQFLFLYEHYLYAPVLHTNKCKLSFSWNQ